MKKNKTQKKPNDQKKKHTQKHTQKLKKQCPPCPRSRTQVKYVILKSKCQNQNHAAQRQLQIQNIAKDFIALTQNQRLQTYHKRVNELNTQKQKLFTKNKSLQDQYKNLLKLKSECTAKHTKLLTELSQIQHKQAENTTTIKQSQLEANQSQAEAKEAKAEVVRIQERLNKINQANALLESLQMKCTTENNTLQNEYKGCQEQKSIVHQAYHKCEQECQTQVSQLKEKIEQQEKQRDKQQQQQLQVQQQQQQQHAQQYEALKNKLTRAQSQLDTIKKQNLQQELSLESLRMEKAQADKQIKALQHNHQAQQQQQQQQKQKETDDTQLISQLRSQVDHLNGNLSNKQLALQQLQNTCNSKELKLEQQLQAVQSNLQDSITLKAKMIQELSDCNADKKILNNEYLQAVDKDKILESQLLKVKSNLKSYEDQLQRASESSKRLEASKGEIQKELNTIQLQYKQSTSKLAKYKEHESTLQNQINDFKLLNSQQSLAVEQAKQKVSELQQQKHKQNVSITKILDLNNQIKQYEQTIAECEKRFKKQEDEYDTLEDEYDTLDFNSREVKKQRQECEKQFKALTQKHQSCVDSKSKLTLQIESLKETIKQEESVKLAAIKNLQSNTAVVSKLKLELKNSRNNALQQSNEMLTSLRQSNKALQQQVSVITQKEQATMAKVNTAQQEVNTAQQEVIAAKQKVDAEKKARAMAQEATKQLKAEVISIQKDLNDAKSQVTVQQDIAQQLKEAQDARDIALANMKKTKAKAKALYEASVQKLEAAKKQAKVSSNKFKEEWTAWMNRQIKKANAESNKAQAANKLLQQTLDKTEQARVQAIQSQTQIKQLLLQTKQARDKAIHSQNEINQKLNLTEQARNKAQAANKLLQQTLGETRQARDEARQEVQKVQNQITSIQRTIQTRSQTNPITNDIFQQFAQALGYKKADLSKNNIHALVSQVRQLKNHFNNNKCLLKGRLPSMTWLEGFSIQHFRQDNEIYNVQVDNFNNTAIIHSKYGLTVTSLFDPSKSFILMNGPVSAFSFVHKNSISFIAAVPDNYRDTVKIFKYTQESEPYKEFTPVSLIEYGPHSISSLMFFDLDFAQKYDYNPNPKLNLYLLIGTQEGELFRYDMQAQDKQKLIQLQKDHDSISGYSDAMFHKQSKIIKMIQVSLQALFAITHYEGRHKLFYIQYVSDNQNTYQFVHKGSVFIENYTSVTRYQDPNGLIITHQDHNNNNNILVSLYIVQNNIVTQISTLPNQFPNETTAFKINLNNSFICIDSNGHVYSGGLGNRPFKPAVSLKTANLGSKISNLYPIQNNWYLIQSQSKVALLKLYV